MKSTRQAGRAGRARVSWRSRHRAGHRARAPTPSCRASGSRGIPTGSGIWSVRASYGLFYDQFQNGSGTASQVAISATPWAQFNQFSGAGLNFQNPYQGRPLPAPNTFVRPSTVFALDAEATSAVGAELERRACSGRSFEQIPRRSPLRRRGREEPPAQRRGQPGGLRSRRDGAERRPAADLCQLPRRRRHLRFLDDRDAAEHHEARPIRRARRASRGASAAASASTCRTGIREPSTICRR